MSMKHWWTDTDRENRSTLIKTSSSTTFSMTNSAWNGLGLNLSLLDDRPASPTCIMVWLNVFYKVSTKTLSGGTGSTADRS
jgi:hypothetical protein